MPNVDTVAAWETFETFLVPALKRPDPISERFIAESASCFVRVISMLPHSTITRLVMTPGGYRFACCIPPGLQMLEDDIHFLRHEYQL